MKHLRLLFCLIYILLPGQVCYGQDYITVTKNGVVHNFVRTGRGVDNFTRDHFLYWEKETFAVFEQVKAPNGIALDLGAWIGTTAIWLSNNFKYVIAVEADPVSLSCLENNLQASSCHNVTICPRPISNRTKEVIFGPQQSHHELNLSTSIVKQEKNNKYDFSTQSLTLKQIIFNYINQNESINQYPISFIKCDIEGSEEEILEDLLHYAYDNNCKAFISFHYDWWKTKNIRDYSPLFQFFKTNCPQEDICEFIVHNPFASLLFEPIIESR